MPIRENREYRSIPLFRDANNETNEYMVEGYATTFDEYELFRDGDTIFRERVEPTAFDGCDMSDVVFLLDHAGRVYARTRNGSVALEVDGHGLHCGIDLSRSAAARGVHEDIKCGNYDKMSFAFTVAEDAVYHDKNANTYTRVIKRFAKIFDISAVGFPANSNTAIGVSARSAFDGFIEAERQLELAEQAEKRRKQKIRILCEVNR